MELLEIEIAAREAISAARDARRAHGRINRRGHLQRELDIDQAAQLVRDAMVPIRSQIARFPYGTQTAAAKTEDAKLRYLSLELQKERRKLFKFKGKQITHE